MAQESLRSGGLDRRRFLQGTGALLTIEGLRRFTGCGTRGTVDSSVTSKQSKKEETAAEKAERLAAFNELHAFAKEHFPHAISEVHEGGPIALLLLGEDHINDRLAVKSAIETADEHVDLEVLGVEGFLLHPDNEKHREISQRVAYVLTGSKSLPEPDAQYERYSMDEYFSDDRFEKVVGLEREDSAMVVAFAQAYEKSLHTLGNAAMARGVTFIKKVPNGFMAIPNPYIDRMSGIRKLMVTRFGYQEFPEIDIDATEENGYVLNRDNVDVLLDHRDQFDIWLNRHLLGPRNRHARTLMIETMKEKKLRKGAMVFGDKHFCDKTSDKYPLNHTIVGPSIQGAIKEKYGEGRVGYVLLDGSQLPRVKEEKEEERVYGPVQK